MFLLIERRDTGLRPAEHQRMDIVRAFQRIHGLEIHESADDSKSISYSLSHHTMQRLSIHNTMRPN